VQWESFLLFCVYFQITFLPVDTETLQLYAQFLSRSFKSVSSIRNYISGIRTVHQLLGYGLDNINSFILNLTLKGIQRLNPHCVKQAAPITPLILSQIYGVLDFSNPDDVVYWCLFVFAFFLLARKSNLVPTSKKDIKMNRCLFRKNVHISGENLVVCMNWSKTIQFGERKLWTPLLNLGDSILCPVKAFQNLCKRVQHEQDDPLFILKDKSTITYNSFHKKLKFCIEKIGLNPKNFSSHSFRRGFATFAFNENISSDQIQLLGDWKSDAYKNYISSSVEDKLDILRSVKPKLLY